MAKQRKLSEVFLDVLPHLSTKYRFVCWAISRAKNQGAISVGEAYRASDYILAQLAGSPTAEDYLHYHYKICTGEASFKQCLDYRRRWVAHIINELEAKGN